MKTIATLASLLVVCTLAGAQGHRNDSVSHRQRIHQDEKAVAADQAKLKQGRKVVIQLRKRLNRDMRSHHQAAAQSDQRNLVKASDAMKFDQAQLKLDREKLQRERSRFHAKD